MQDLSIIPFTVLCLVIGPPVHFDDVLTIEVSSLVFIHKENPIHKNITFEI